MTSNSNESSGCSKYLALGLISFTVWLLTTAFIGTIKSNHNSAATHSAVVGQTTNREQQPVKSNQTPTPPSSFPKPAYPTGADAVDPSMRNFVKQLAREYGISEEEARQAMRKGFRQGYPGEEVDKIFGK